MYRYGCGNGIHKFQSYHQCEQPDHLQRTNGLIDGKWCGKLHLDRRTCCSVQSKYTDINQHNNIYRNWQYKWLHRKCCGNSNRYSQSGTERKQSFNLQRSDDNLKRERSYNLFLDGRFVSCIQPYNTSLDDNDHLYCNWYCKRLYRNSRFHRYCQA